MREMGGQQRHDEIQVRELTAVITERAQFTAAFTGPGHKAPIGGNLVSDRPVIIAILMVFPSE